MATVGEAGLETSPELAIITLLINAIDNNNYDQLHTLLKLLPLDKMIVDRTDKLLSMLLTECWEYNRARLVSTILNAWEKVYPKEEKISFYIQLFLMPLLGKDILRFVILQGLPHKGLSYFSIMTDLINYHDQLVTLAAEKVFRVYGQVGYDTLMNLLDIAEEEENAPIINHLRVHIREVAPYQEIPPWVNDFTVSSLGEDKEENQLPSFEDTYYLPPDPVITLPSDQELLTLYRQELWLFYSPTQIEIMVSNMAQKLPIIGGEEKLAQFAPILLRHAYLEVEKRDEDSILFRLYGPTNPSIDPSLDELRYGGQRMFLAVNRPELNEDQIEEVTDWFTGSCDKCLLKIRRRWHALRIPIMGGGWQGCYCTARCIEDALATPIAFDSHISADIVMLGLLDEMEKDIKAVGVQDHSDDGPIIPLSYYDKIIDPISSNIDQLLDDVSADIFT